MKKTIHKIPSSLQAMMKYVIVAALASASIFVMLVGAVETAEQKNQAPQQPPAPAPSVPVAIPEAEIAIRATEASNQLRDFETKLVPSSEIEVIRKVLPDVSATIDLALASVTSILRGQPTLETLQSEEKLWKLKKLQMTEWLSILTMKAQELEDVQDHLAKLQGIWTITRDAAQSAKAPEQVLEQTKETIAAIKAAQPPVQNQLKAILDLQGRVAAEVGKSERALDQIAQVQQKAVKGIFMQDNPPIWSSKRWENGFNIFRERVPQIVGAYGADIMQHVSDPSKLMPLYILLFVGLSILFWASRREVLRWTATNQLESTAFKVLHHPYAAALAVCFFIVTSPVSQIPTTVRIVFSFFAVVPVIILLRHLVGERVVVLLYVLALLFLLDTIRRVFAGTSLIDQTMLIFESLALFVAAGFVLSNLRQYSGEAIGSLWMKALRLGIGFLLLIFVSSLVASTLGYLRLARLLTPGFIGGVGLALGLSALLLVVNSAVAVSFRLWPLRLLGMVQHHRQLLERRVYGLLICAAILAWVTRYLSNLGLLEPAFSFGKNLIGTKLEHGTISVSLGDIIDFFITVWAAYLLSSFIQFVLREDVYPKIGISPGKSYALSSLFHYIIIALGFVVGIGVLGVNLSKMTVLTGAFGIGIGFGMQSVVNNFVSGLILLMEQPIHVGDTIEVSDLLGKVRRIGIRASTVHTIQGADIVVPNSQLITEKVTNWTLSDRLRRLDLPVGVGYDSVPNEVIKVLEGVAIAHPQILKEPRPQALFMAYGDSSINFELRAWTSEFDNWPQIRSDLAVAVYDAVRAAGMTFPFPQREVRLLRDTDQGSDTAAISYGNKT